MSAQRCQPGRLLALAACGLLAAPAGAGTLDPTQDARHVVSVSARADAEYDLDEVEVFTLAPFDEALEIERIVAGSSAAAMAELDAVITPTRVEVSGFTSSAASSIDPQFAQGVGQALFRLEFTVAEPTPFDLRLVVSGTGDEPDVNAYLESNDDFYEIELNDVAGYEELELSGVLEPGRFYNLYAFAFMGSGAGQGGPGASAGTASFDLWLAVPEPHPLALLLTVGWGVRRFARSCIPR